MEHKLRVWCNGMVVGTISFDDATDAFSLTYDPGWIERHGFPVSPRLAFDRIAEPGASLEVRRFLENLLPEGQALEDVANLNRLSKANLYGLIRVLGKESAGAFTITAEDVAVESLQTAKREITHAELSERIRDRQQIPFSVWDGKVRMSIAGYQDKIAVYRGADGKLFLVEGALASTFILKPVPRNEALRHLVINECFCMRLASRVGLNVANVELLRVPEPVLLVERFDRLQRGDGEGVERLHIIDGCQALGLPSAYKYERNFGNGADVRDIREGASLPKLFDLTNAADNKSKEIQKLLRWTMFQYLIGNTDAHAKNVSYFLDDGGMRLAPAYDLVAVEMHECFERDIAMAIGDAFRFDEVRPFDWAEFASNCRIPRLILGREMVRMAKSVADAVGYVLDHFEYADQQEATYLRRLAEFVIDRSAVMMQHAKLAPKVSGDLLSVDWQPDVSRSVPMP